MPLSEISVSIITFIVVPWSVYDTCLHTTSAWQYISHHAHTLVVITHIFASKVLSQMPTRLAISALKAGVKCVGWGKSPVLCWHGWCHSAWPKEGTRQVVKFLFLLSLLLISLPCPISAGLPGVCTAVCNWKQAAMEESPGRWCFHTLYSLSHRVYLIESL